MPQSPRDFLTEATQLSTEQHQLEIKMAEMGKARHRRKVQSAIEGGRRSSVGGGRSLLRAAVRVSLEELEGRLKRKGKGKRHAAFPYIRAVKPKSAVYIALRTMIDNCTSAGGADPGARLTRVAVLIGKRVEDEVQLREFRKRYRNSYLYAARLTENSNDYSYKSGVMRHIHGLADDEQLWEPWPDRIRALVGTLLIDVALTATGMFEVLTLRTSRRRTRKFLCMTQQAIEEIARRDEALELMRPWYLPSVAQPRPWRDVWDGGYHTAELPQQPLVKTHNRWYLEQLAQAPMPVVYKGVNALQETPWEVNEDVWCVATTLWEARSELAGLPQQDPRPLPPRPEWLPPPTEDSRGQVRLSKEQRASLSEDQRKEFKAWKLAARGIHTMNAQRGCKVVLVSKLLVVADLMRKHRAFYFPHQLDWRGRAYPMPLFLNPQGNDLARGMLRFAIAKPVGETGGRWMAIHGANSWGYDKASLEERAGWVEENEEMILRCAEDPLTHLDWAEADSPFQFLAFCLEWAEFLESGRSPEYRSKLPVHMDGTCNGLQHFSAMLRDPMGAEATNLIPAKKPQDIYQRVADRLERRLKAIGHYARAGTWDNAAKMVLESTYARQWLASGLIDRSLVKRQVMTLPYGVTRYGMREQLDSHLKKAGHRPEDFFEDVLPAEVFFVDELHTAIDEVVHAAQRAMEFLRECAAVANESDMPLAWITPTGFPVRQHYPNESKYLVKTMLLGEIMQLTLRREHWDGLSRRRQVAGVSPNFVHSMDAAHMMATIVATEYRAQQPLSWVMVHDSYGTHPGDCEDLSVALREQFVKMYEGHDVLEEFRAGLAEVVKDPLPEVPEKGELDISRVLEADYFFA